MKKRVAILLCLLACIVSTVVCAEGDVDVTYSQYEFKLETVGSFEAPLNLVIFSNISEETELGDMTAETALAAGYSPVFIKQYELFGEHTIFTPLPQDLEDGSILVFLDGRLSGSYPYVSWKTITDQVLVFPQLNAAKNNAEEIKRIINDNKEVLVLDKTSLQFWDVEAAGILANYLPIDGANESEKMITFKKAYKISTACREINLKEDSAEIEAVLKANAEELDFDVEKFGKMTESEKRVYTDVLHRADFVKNATIDIFREAEVVVTCAGAKHSSNLRRILEENSSYIGIDTSKCSNLTDVCVNMMDGITSVRSYQDIRELFKEAQKTPQDTSSRPSGSGGGGGGTGRKPNQPLRIENNESSNASAAEISKNSESFNDLEGVAWAKEAVLYLKQRGIVNGVAEGRFNPNDYVTRAEFAKLIACAGGLEPFEEEFADVNSDDWFCKYIGACSKAGIMFGTGDGAMNPNSSITRQDAAVMIKRLADRQKALPNGEHSFADEKSIEDYAVEAVKLLAEKGIINGYEDNTFRPGASITRAESAVILYRLLTI